jgi:DNA recombination protein RmuC
LHSGRKKEAMEVLWWVPLLVLAAIVGLFGGRWSLQRRLEGMRAEKEELARHLAEERARREAESAAAARQLEEGKELREQAETSFKSLSAEALAKSNEQFLSLAKQVFGRLQEGAKGDLEKRQQAINELVEPVRKSLEKVDEKIQAVEKAREGAYSGLKEQIRQLLESEGKLRSETNNLVFALRTPNVRGRWGEVQLERTVEFAGMTEFVDFVQQESGEGENGRQRPDLIVRLPGKKRIIVDAKAPLDAYLKALEAGDDGDEGRRQIERHARQIREHIKALSGKQYWRQFTPAPEFVVLFLPGEAFFSAALEADPGLIEYGAEANVLPATPTTLIALLKAAAYGWRQEAIAEEAREISRLGRELYERIGTQTEHFTDVGKALKRAVESYNKSLSSLESRVLVTARKFDSLAVDSKKKLPDSLDPVEVQPRQTGNEE